VSRGVRQIAAIIVSIVIVLTALLVLVSVDRLRFQGREPTFACDPGNTYTTKECP
jgi:hypothetical protein